MRVTWLAVVGANNLMDELNLTQVQTAPPVIDVPAEPFGTRCA